MLDILSEAESLAVALDDPSRLGWVSVALGHSFWLLGDQKRVIASSQRALALAETLSEEVLRMVATFNLGRTYWDLGDYRQAMAYLRRSAEALESDLLWERFGQAYLPSVFSRVWLALCLAEGGAFGEGIAMGEEGIRIAEAVDHPFSRIGAYWGVGYVYRLKGDLHQAIHRLEHALGLSQGVNTPSWFFTVAPPLSLAYTLSGRRAEALGLLEQWVARGAMRLMGHQALRVTAFGAAHLLAGHLEEASAHAREALALAHTHKERGNEAWTLRLLGDITVQHDLPQIEPAEDYYHQALTLAEELGMRPLVVHCHHGLGTLYAKVGQPVEARGSLAAAIELYRAMDMTQVEAALAQVEG